ncbi:MAG: GTP 3',8-cyclase MoaA [Planctomycetes bacterium]|nr:GTP 3',8-cyclase MoaA [Planctomycetota bacterium]
MTDPPSARPSDRLARPLRSFRISVTDRCNLRCSYCMPEEHYTWLPRSDILTFDETARIASCFVRLGVDKLRITGGEPLLRQDLPELIVLLARIHGVRDIALTTNGVLLPRFGAALRDAGVRRVTVSLDTLRADRFVALTGRDQLAATLAGIDRAVELWPGAVKLNAVVMRDRNDDELVDLLRFARARGVELRFIEYMDVGGATAWSGATVVSRREILARLAERFGAPVPCAERDWAPADRFRLPDGTVFGVISSTTEPFCRTCDRARLTADGMWYTCLYAKSGVDLRSAVRCGATDAELDALVARRWRERTDRGAEERHALREARGPLAARDELADDPHLEMHKRGG